MKKILFILSCLIISTAGWGQSSETNQNSELYKNAPDWAKRMYSPNPNANEIDQLYSKYYRSNKYVKSYHTQYYKRWRKAINPFLNNSGYFDSSKKNNLSRVIDGLKNHQENNENTRSNSWSVMGPFRNFAEGGVVESGAQANVYTIGQCNASPNVMYCGTEPGEVYKSLDSGNTWFNVSKFLVTAYTPDAVTANAGIFALAVHPTNSDIVYIGSGSQVFKTTDGGGNWISIFDSGIELFGYIENPAELYINSSNPQIVLVAGKEGIYRTNDDGETWSQVLTNESFDIKEKPGDPNTLYTIRKNTFTNTHQFLISTDAGITWTPESTGWYISTDPSRTVVGARIAVTAANSERIYAFLIGDSKPGDNGFIGVYRSNDGGASWTNTMDYDGAPYLDPEHPNLISSSPVTNDFSFNQGFYNCAIMASNTNADQLLVGGIGMWRSSDAGQSFQCIYNYPCGDYNPMHVDQQDYRAFGNQYWATTDGGIYRSYDLFNTQPEFKMNGVHAIDFWGFGSGWNNDLLVGGTFHNGVDVYSEGFPNGDFLDLGGGEPASGYVNPGNQLRIYSTNIGSKIIPQSITEAVLGASFEISPNENAWFAESSEMEFHPSCYNYIYTGSQNKLFKSMDGGASFSEVYTANANTTVLGIEISRQNTNTMYIVVRPNSDNAYIVKTTNDWATNSIVTLPGGGNNLALISLDPENDQVIWLAYPRGDDGNKVFKSIDGGTTWVNETSSELDAQNIQAITTIGGTDGGVYIATNITCYYKNNAMSSWEIDNVDLPLTIGATGIRPFYRDGKLRLASYGKGIWESQLYETPSRPVAKIMVDKLIAELNCNIFYFDDYSMLNHTNATWSWTFENADITTSSIRNPQVIFNTAGNHTVTLTVTDANGISASDTLVVSTVTLTSADISQNFEVALLQSGWFQESTGSFAWSYNDLVGGFGQSTKCMSVNNFIISQQGFSADLTTPVNMSDISPENATLSFDVAYALYAAGYADTLQVLVSTDCGVNYEVVYNKGGTSLSTAPDTQEQFVPSASEWRKDSIDLSSYVGNANVYIKFRNINQYGQALYVDNINLAGTMVNIQELDLNSVFVYPNPVSSNSFINVKGIDNGKIEFNLLSIEGKTIDKIFTKFNTPISIDKYNLSQGTYLYKIFSNDKILNGKLIISDRK
jgi:PKD domain/Secretion system C-terminal sorting domain